MIRDYLLRSCCNFQNCLARRKVPLRVINSIVLQSFCEKRGNRILYHGQFAFATKLAYEPYRWPLFD